MDQSAIQQLQAESSKFFQYSGRRPRILLFVLNSSGESRNQNKIASILADAGFDVDIGPLGIKVIEAAGMAVENDVHVVGIATGKDDPEEKVSALISELNRLDAAEILVTVTGELSKSDKEAALDAGATAVISEGDGAYESVIRILDTLIEMIGPGESSI